MDSEFRQRATLKEKLVSHYHNRDFTIQPGSASKAGLIMTAFMLSSLFLEGMFILLPGVYRTTEEGPDGLSLSSRPGYFGEGYWLMVLVVVFLFVETVWNWWRTYYDVANWVRKETKAVYYGQMLDTPPGWKSCPTCQVDAPPRSHHCNMCGHCILKRDHHCFFTGSCIGFFNQRHFVMFCSYVMGGGLVAVYLQLSYLNTFLPLAVHGYTYFAPVSIAQFLTGNLALWAFLLFVHMYMTIVFIAVAGFFLTWQLIIILRGQTSHEAWKNINVYNVGFCGNFKSVFGSPLWSWILLFAPLMLPLTDDGVKWITKPKPDKGY